MEPQPTLDRGWFRGRKFSSSGQGAATVAAKKYQPTVVQAQSSRRDSFCHRARARKGTFGFSCLALSLFCLSCLKLECAIMQGVLITENAKASAL